MENVSLLDGETHWRLSFEKEIKRYSPIGQQHAQRRDWWQRPYEKQLNRLSFHFPVGTWSSSASLSVLSTSAATGAAMMGSSSLLPERSGWSKLVSSLSALILSVLEYVDTRSQIQQDVNWKWSYFNNVKIREYNNTFTCVWNRKECKWQAGKVCTISFLLKSCISVLFWGALLVLKYVPLCSRYLNFWISHHL